MYPFPHSDDFYSTNSASYDDFLLSHSPFTPFPRHLLVYDHLDSPQNLSQSHSSSTSGCSSYGSPNYATSQGPSLMQRSISSLSLQKNDGVHSGFMSANEYLDTETDPVGRVCSTDDLHGINMGQYYHKSGSSPLTSESSIIIDGMNRASRYNPEEKKERIERYRTKRTQRNFSKKIKYACRKTLADSRPRIRGRFARNEEIEKNPQVHWNNIGGEEYDEEENHWINYLDSISSGNLFS